MEWIILWLALMGLSAGVGGIITGIVSLVGSICIMAMIGDFFLLKLWDRDNWKFDKKAQQNYLAAKSRLSAYYCNTPYEKRDVNVYAKLYTEMRRWDMRRGSRKDCKRTKEDFLKYGYSRGLEGIPQDINYPYEKDWFLVFCPLIVKMREEEVNSWKLD